MKQVHLKHIRASEKKSICFVLAGQSWWTCFQIYRYVFFFISGGSWYYSFSWDFKNELVNRNHMKATKLLILNPLTDSVCNKCLIASISRYYSASMCISTCVFVSIDCIVIKSRTVSYSLLCMLSTKTQIMSCHYSVFTSYEWSIYDYPDSKANNRCFSSKSSRSTCFLYHLASV